MRLAVAALLLAGLVAAPVRAQQPSPAEPPELHADASPVLPQTPPANQFSSDEIIDAGYHFFNGVSRDLASVVENAVSQWGRPNGYILGEEAGGAFIGGLRYGDGTLYTKNAGDLRVFWEGPTVGVDAGGDGARTMMLVYNLPRTEAIFDRFGGVTGSAYFVGGFGMTALTSNDNVNDMVVVPFRTRAAARIQFRLSQIHSRPDLESVLIETTRTAALGRGPRGRRELLPICWGLVPPGRLAHAMADMLITPLAGSLTTSSSAKF